MLLHRCLADVSCSLTRWQHFLHDTITWPPRWKYDVISQLWLHHWCIFTSRKIVPNFIPNSRSDLKRLNLRLLDQVCGHPNKKKMSSDMRSVTDLKISLLNEINDVLVVDTFKLTQACRWRQTLWRSERLKATRRASSTVSQTNAFPHANSSAFLMHGGS